MISIGLVILASGFFFVTAASVPTIRRRMRGLLKVSTSQERSRSQYRLVIAGLLLLANLALGLSLFAASPILPLIIEDYGISRASAGLLVTLALLIAAVFEFYRGGGLDSSENDWAPGTIGYWVYRYDRQRFYPFVPEGDEERNRPGELQISRMMSKANVTVEKELEEWRPIWGIPF